MASGVDPVIGLGQVLAVFVGASTAAIIAAHLVVLIAGGAGAVLGLMSWRTCTLAEALRYLVGMSALAWLFSGAAAELLAGYLQVEDKRMVLPVALGIGWIGHRWPDVAKWFGRLAKSFVETAFRAKVKDD